MIKSNYRTKPVDVFALQIFQKDIEAAFEIESAEYASRERQKPRIDGKRIKSTGRLSSCNTNLLGEIPIRLVRNFDKGGTREWYITGYLIFEDQRTEIRDGYWITKEQNGTYSVCSPAIFDKLYEKID